MITMCITLAASCCHSQPLLDPLYSSHFEWHLWKFSHTWNCCMSIRRCCVSLHQYAQSSRKALVCSPTSGCYISHTSTVWCIGRFCSRWMCVSSVYHKVDKIIPVGLWIKSLKNILLVLWSQYVVYAIVFRLLVVALCPKHISKRKALTLSHRLKWQYLANKGIHLTLFIDTHHGCNPI